MSYQWRFYPEQTILLEQISRETSISHLAARLLVNRGISSVEEAATFLQPELSSLSDPYDMTQMEIAVERILQALKGKEQILVYGDSDVDGVSGTALLCGFLRAVGGKVTTYIPNRLEEGYSLTDRGVDTILERQARVVITVDNGTSAVRHIARLQEQGVDVIISDHHEASGELPPAIAILNPKVKGNGYPFPYLCGTAVAFQLLSALAARLPARGSTQDAMLGLLRHSIAFVAMATICDCVPLIGENRVLARAGLAALKGTEHPGLKALLSIAGVSREVQSDDISFRLGPRINAAGRLGRADQALELLLADTKERAQQLARELDEHNAERQQIEADILANARARAKEMVRPEDPVIVMADERWHSGVVGIVAARLASEFSRPTILIALQQGRGRGSGRSVGGFDLYRALSRCREHLVAFGGHAYAAGMEIRPESFDTFRDALMSVASESWGGEPERTLMIDAELPLGGLNATLMNEFNRLAPFGEAMPVPILAVTDLALDGAPRVVGKNQSHLSFMVRQSTVRKKAIAFGQAYHIDRLSSANSFSLAFTPRLNFFRGRASVDLEVKDFRFSDTTT